MTFIITLNIYQSPVEGKRLGSWVHHLSQAEPGVDQVCWQPHPSFLEFCGLQGVWGQQAKKQEHLTTHPTDPLCKQPALTKETISQRLDPEPRSLHLLFFVKQVLFAFLITKAADAVEQKITPNLLFRPLDRTCSPSNFGKTLKL